MNASTITVYLSIYLACILGKSPSRAYACAEFLTFLAKVLQIFWPYLDYNKMIWFSLGTKAIRTYLKIQKIIHLNLKQFQVQDSIFKL